MFSSHILRECFSSYNVRETTRRNVHKQHIVTSGKQKLLHSNPTTFQPLGEICNTPYLIEFVHIIRQKVYYLTSGSFRHGYVTETKCLKKSEQFQIVTADRAQYLCTQKTQYSNAISGQRLKSHCSFCLRIPVHRSRTSDIVGQVKYSEESPKEDSIRRQSREGLQELKCQNYLSVGNY